MRPTLPLLAALLLCLGSLTSARAQGVLTFQEELHDFGRVPEGTVAAHEFRFKNTGNQPVVLGNVQASCGCTTPEWTRTPILPGKTGVVKVLYNSTGRPGVFNKTISVASNAAPASAVLTIKGTVLSREEIRKTLTPAELAAAPRAVAAQPVHSFGRIEIGQQLVARFVVQNPGRQTLTFGGISSGCYCIGFKMPPAPIGPGQSGTVELLYAQRKPGAMVDEATLSTNDPRGDLKLTLKAEVVKSLNAASLVRETDVSVPFK